MTSRKVSKEGGLELVPGVRIPKVRGPAPGAAPAAPRAPLSRLLATSGRLLFDGSAAGHAPTQALPP
jgi:hypothetical protein